MNRKIKLKIVGITCIGVLGGIIGVQAHYIRKLEDDYKELKSTYKVLWLFGSYFLKLIEYHDIDLDEFDLIALADLGKLIEE